MGEEVRVTRAECRGEGFAREIFVGEARKGGIKSPRERSYTSWSMGGGKMMSMMQSRCLPLSYAR